MRLAPEQVDVGPVRPSALCRLIESAQSWRINGINGPRESASWQANLRHPLLASCRRNRNSRKWDTFSLLLAAERREGGKGATADSKEVSSASPPHTPPLGTRPSIFFFTLGPNRQYFSSGYLLPPPLYHLHSHTLRYAFHYFPFKSCRYGYVAVLSAPEGTDR